MPAVMYRAALAESLHSDMGASEGCTWTHEKRHCPGSAGPLHVHMHTQSMSLCANGDRWGMKLSDPYSVVLEALVGRLLFVNVLIRLRGPPV